MAPPIRLLIPLLLLPMLLLAGCIDLFKMEDDVNTITLYGFSVKGEVFEDRVIPAFKELWKEETGKDVEFKTLFAGSGKITNQVLAGAPAEIMILSTEWDLIQLRKAGLTDMELDGLPWNGTLSTTPWVIVTREGNPKGITDIPDLGRSGLTLVHADPLTSGGACWSIFAVYGSELRRTYVSEGAPNKTAAEGLVRDVVDNVIGWQSSARAALSQFVLGYGDALLTYENEALLARKEGERFDIIYPSSTILSEHKPAIIDRNVDPDEMPMMERFVDFLFTPEVQSYMVEYDFRSMNESLNGAYRPIEDPFTVEYLGGWEKAHPELIDGLFKEIKG